MCSSCRPSVAAEEPRALQPISEVLSRAQPVPLWQQVSFRSVLALTVGYWLAGCGHAPLRPVDAQPQPAVAQTTDFSLAAEIAASMIGRPYLKGGSAPGDGFDCSGLVHYAYSVLGFGLPRTAATQQDATKPVAAQDIAVGDLLFFRLGGAINHVGIYYGNGQFVHAPSHGKAVMRSRLDSPYWRPRLAGIGRPVPVFQ